MDQFEVLMQQLSNDRLILLMTATLCESIRLGDEEGYKTCSLMLARELARRQVDPLPSSSPPSSSTCRNKGPRPRQPCSEPQGALLRLLEPGTAQAPAGGRWLTLSELLLRPQAQSPRSGLPLMAGARMKAG
jgi:hypothetical protein